MAFSPLVVAVVEKGKQLLGEREEEEGGLGGVSVCPTKTDDTASSTASSSPVPVSRSPLGGAGGGDGARISAVNTQESHAQRETKGVRGDGAASTLLVLFR